MDKEIDNVETRGEIVPIETIDAQIKSTLPTRSYIAALREKAELALEEKQLRNQILVAFTGEKDWAIIGKNACLSSAGAERISAHFPISITDVKREKVDFEDDKGKGYRYIYSGKASLGDREVFIQGAYSTREAFFGVEAGELKLVEDISETNVMTAAYHRMRGEAIKTLLGLRNIPVEEFEKIGIGKSTSNMGGHTFETKEKKEPLPSPDRGVQRELFNLLVAMHGEGFVFDYGEKGPEITECGDVEAQVAIALSVESLSTFVGKDGRKIMGKSSVIELSDKQLNYILPKAKKMWEIFLTERE